MRIAFTGNVFPFGPYMAYGGERILYYLATELSKFGHDVFVFAREGTQVPNAKAVFPVGPLTNDKDVHFEAVKATGIDFDIYQCNYFGDGWTRESQNTFPYVELTWNRWCHAFFQFKEKPFNVIAYSRVLQNDFKNTGIDTTMIHYGIPEDLYRFEPENDGYAVWIGKIEGGKAPHLAIQIAKAAGLKMVVMGPPYNTGCFWKLVYPHIDNKNVFWVRGVDDYQKYKIMSRAKVFIYSNDNTWKEHFGIVMAEAHAMGVPIVGMNRLGHDCSVRVDNIIQHGRNGFILDYKDSNDVDDIVYRGREFVGLIDKISRHECRLSFEERFTSRLMAERYNWLYQRVANGEKFGTVEIPI